jgi:hypothetical protein
MNYSELAYEIINSLADRSGFDSLLSNLDDDIKEEIRAEIAEIIKNNLQNQK